jgi:hypothetical protein
MFRRVVHGEPRPRPATFAVAKAVDERLGAMGVEVVHQQVNGLGRRMGLGDPLERLGKLRCLAIRRGVSVMATALGLYDAEDVRGAAALVFIVAACDLARRHRLTGSHRIKQLHRPFVQGDHWRSWIGRLAQNVQHLLHPLDVFLVQLRDAPHFFPATALARGA